MTHRPEVSQELVMRSGNARFHLCFTTLCFTALLFTVLGGFEAPAQAPLTRLNPTVKQIVDQVSEERISATMKRLGEFGTRYVGSAQDSETRGIGAAQGWMEAQFKSYSPKLQVSLDKFTVKKNQRLPKDADLANIVALLPGTTDKDRYVIV